MVDLPEFVLLKQYTIQKQLAAALPRCPFTPAPSIASALEP
jgi:hypothetical protein